MMEDRVRELEIDSAVMKAQMTSMKEALDENTLALRAMTEVMARTKGAWWVLGAAATLIAFVVNAAIGFFKS